MVIIAYDNTETTNKIVADQNSQFFVSKFEVNGIRPPIGSSVQLRGTVLTGGETSINVYPLKEDYPPGTILAFGGGLILLKKGAFKGKKVIDNVTVPAGSYVAEDVATVNGIEQVLTLASDLAVGNQVAVVNAIDYLLEQGRIITFSNGAQFRVTQDCDIEAGETEIFGELLPTTTGNLSDGTVVASTGETSLIPWYEMVCSAESFQFQNNGESITTYLLKDGQDANNDVVSRNREFSIGGKEIDYDFGYERFIRQTEGGINSGREKAYVLAVSGYGGRQVGARACVGNESLNTQKNQHNTLNATVKIDGKITRYNLPHVAIY